MEGVDEDLAIGCRRYLLLLLLFFFFVTVAPRRYSLLGIFFF